MDSLLEGAGLALPITIGAVRYPGIKIHDPRVIRLSRSSCTAVVRSLAGPPSTSTTPSSPPASKLEAAYHRADKAIQQIVDLLAA
jgi:hypothetical protein